MEFDFLNLVKKWKNGDEINIRENIQQLLNWLILKRNSKDMFKLELNEQVKDTLKFLINTLEHNQNPEVLILSSTCVSFIIFYSSSTPYYSLNCFFRLMIKDNLDIALNKQDTNVSFSNENLFKTLQVTNEQNNFQTCAFLGGLLNNRFMISQLINSDCSFFFTIHSFIIKSSYLKTHTFHVFKILLNWFRILKSFHSKLFPHFKPSFDESNEIVLTLKSLDTNWESSFSGVNDCVKAIYKLLIELHITYYPHIYLKSDTFLISQAQESIKWPWDWKGKYRKLSILIPLIGWQKILQMEPKLHTLLFKYMSINNLASAVTECYKCLVSSLSMSQNGQNVWSSLFLDLISKAVISDNSVIYENTIAHLLPFTLVNISNSFQLLSGKLNTINAQTVLIRVALKNKIDLKGSKDEKFLKLSLSSQEESVRLESLSLLLEFKIIQNKINLMKLFKYFLIHNLNIDCPLFRQKLIFKISGYFRKWLRPSNRRTNFDLKTFQQDFILFENFLFANLIPGANFQRRTTSLLLLDSLLKLNQDFDLTLPISECNANSLLLSIMDRDDTIRKVSSKLLNNILNHKPIVLNLNELTSIAFSLLNCPKHQEAQSGALLMTAIISTGNTQIYVENQEIKNEMNFLQHLLSCLQKKLFIFENDNVLKTSYDHPLHGYLLCINHILSLPKMIEMLNHSHFQEFSNFITHTIKFLDKLVHYMLDFLSSKSNGPQTSPSFKDMSIALNKLMDDDDTISISPQFQCLLTYYWLNIKESCALLSKLVYLQSKSKVILFEQGTLFKIGRLIISALMRCRHKGAIEACSLSLSLFSESTLMINNEREINIPQELLLEILSQLTEYVKHSSITRRSAGFSMSIEALLIGEAKYLKANSNKIKHTAKSSFKIAVEKLINFVNINSNTTNLSNDNIQSVSVHILRSLIISNALSTASLNICERLILICIENFSSLIWSMRNASLQLFGACCLRILGQRKTVDRQVESISGTLSLSNLFFKYPKLESMFESCLTNAIAKQSSNSFESSLIPVLSFISNLSVCGFDATYSQKMASKLYILLSNPVWKVRSLSSRCLISVLNINQLKNELLERLKSCNLTSNYVHGIILTIKNLFLLREEFYLEESLLKEFECNLSKKIQKNSLLANEYKKLFQNSNHFESSGSSSGSSSDEVKLFFDSSNLVQKLTKLADPLSSLSQRLFVITYLSSNKEHLKSIIDNDIDMKVKIYFLILNLLQDEENEVRKKASRFIQILYPISFTPSFNVATEMLFQSLAQIKSDQLVHLLWKQLELFPSLINQDFENEQKLIIFEEENRNIFAEHFIIFTYHFRLIQTLCTQNNKNITLSRQSIDRINKEVAIIDQHTLSVQNLMKLSNGKISKLFTKLFNLLIRVHLASNHCLSLKDKQNLNLIKSKTNQIFDMIDNFLKLDDIFRKTKESLFDVYNGKLNEIDQNQK